MVARPEEVGRELVNNLNRAARAVDDDPWGDCLTGIITGADAAAAQKIAADDAPLTVKRLLGTTNVSPARFEHSCCITDWSGSPVLEQSGYTEPTTTPCPEEALRVFAEQLGTQKPQLLVTSSHATQFNLEMPFSKGLIFPDGKSFRLLPTADMGSFGTALGKALKGDTAALCELAKSHEAIPADGERRVWLAAGNCLLGDAAHSACSMAVTALSGYDCRQMAGYTVPSWFGRSGWGSLSVFMGNHDGTSMAEAVFLSNQFMLRDTQALDPKLLGIRFNDAEFAPYPIYQKIMAAGVQLADPAQMKEAMGLIHDRDTFALFGDPAWRAVVDTDHAHAPFRIEWTGPRSFTITANGDTTERCGLWLPDSISRDSVNPSATDEMILTNDFILFPKLGLKAGESRSYTLETR